MKRGLLATFLTMAALALTGCGDNGQSEIDTLKSTALKQDTPWDGYNLILEEMEFSWSKCNGVCSDGRYVALKSADSTMLSLFRKALDESDPRAYSELYVKTPWALSRAVSVADIEAIRRDYVSKLITMVDATKSSPENPALLDIAGYVTAEGRYVHRDYQQAIEYLHRAWLAGSTIAAATAAHTSMDNHDPINAYLWGLRCIGECDLHRAELDSFARSLSLETIRRTQQAVTDRSVSSLEDFDVSEPRQQNTQTEPAVVKDT